MLMELVKREGVKLEEAGLSFAASKSLTQLMRRLEEAPENAELLEHANVLVTLLEMLPFKVDYWQAQNIFYSLMKKHFPFLSKRMDEASRVWTRRFLELGDKLKVRVERRVALRKAG
jgi:hypothetical protein